MRIGVVGLFFFMVGYALVRNELHRVPSTVSVCFSPCPPLRAQGRMEGRGIGIDIPHGGALLRGLAEEEADLLEGLGEGVSAGHGGRSLWGEGG